jgi:methionyl-tRNA formyltransferase
LRVVFAGTPPFAARALEALIASGHEVVAVLTQPDRPAGRGMRVAASAVSRAAEGHGVAVLKPPSLGDAQIQERLRRLGADVMVVAAYGLILPREVLDIPAAGCINIHASLLPRWRGAAPIQRALLAGDRVTGITLMRMDAGLDTGPILLRKEVAIGARDTAGSLTERLAQVGAEAIVEGLASYASLEPRAQDESLACYASKIGKAEALIDWTLSSELIDRRIRAFDPVPGAESRYAGSMVKIWSAEPADGEGTPGEVLHANRDRLVVACGQGAVRIAELQRAGGRRLAAGDFLRGTAVAPGARLG